MIISYCGNLCIKAQIGDTSVSFNPPLRSDGKTPRFSSNVALFSTKEKDQKFSHGAVTDGVFIIDGPGEYEVGGIFIKGVGIEQETKKGKIINTIYSVLFDDITLCHLGAINTSEIKPETLEVIGSTDILFVPITGGNVATPAVASKLSTMLEPHIIVPLQADERGESKDSIKLFLEEEGDDDVDQVDKLTIKKKEIEEKSGEVFILSPQS